MKSLRALPAFVLALGVLPMGRAHAGADFIDAAVARYGPAQQEFLAALLGVKPPAGDAPAQSLVASFLVANTAKTRPPMDFAALASDAELSGEAWLGYAESCYADARFDRSRQALDRIPDAFRRSNLARVDSMQLRLALRGFGQPPALSATPEGEAASGLNQALVMLQKGDRVAALRLLDKLAATAALPEAVRHRARLWLASLHAEAGASGETLKALGGIDGRSPLVAEAMLAHLRIFNDIHPSAASAIERHLREQSADPGMVWEARDYLIRALSAKGASAQASRVALEEIAALNSALVQLDQQLAEVQRKPADDLSALLPEIPEIRRRRINSLVQRRASLAKAGQLLKAWQPHLNAYEKRLRQNPGQFAGEIREAFAGVTGKDGSGDDSTVGADTRFLLALNNLVGSPPNRDTAYRLFFGLAQWEFGAEYPDHWRPSIEHVGDAVDERSRRHRRDQSKRERQDKDLLGSAIEHANQLYAKVSSLAGKSSGAIYPGKADEAARLAARNKARRQEIDQFLPRIDTAVREEVVQGLKERREIAQQWLVRFAYHALTAYTRGNAAKEQPYFDLDQRLSLKAGESLTQSIRAMSSPEDLRKAGDVPVLAAWSALKGIAEGGATRELRAEALRLRGQLTVALNEAQAIPSADDAIKHYESLLRDYGDLVDRAEVTYQLARAQDLTQRMEQSLATLGSFVKAYPDDPRSKEAYFRIGESQFSLGEYALAKVAYEAVLRGGTNRYSDQAEYKLGWAHYKLGDYRGALPRFIAVIERAAGQSATSDRHAQERLRDTFRALSLSFSNLDGARDVERYFAQTGPRPYIADIYYNLGNYYLEHDRINDAAGAYEALVRLARDDTRAPALLAAIVKGARNEKLLKRALEFQEQFVDTYALTGHFWSHASPEVQGEIKGAMQPFLAELAQMYHADAQQQHNKASYAKAVRYYGQYVATFPEASETPHFHFLMAEAKFESADYAGALADYETTAYQYGPHPQAAEAGYAALLANQRLADGETDAVERKATLRALVTRSGLFAVAFPADSRVDAVLVKAGEDILMLGEPAEAARLGDSLLARKPAPAIRQRAALMVAHGHFESGAFAEAEAAYQTVLAEADLAPVLRQELRGRVGLAIYRQAEALRSAGNAEAAIDTFLRVARSAPGAESVPSAEIDAAALLLANQRWGEAIEVLERFRRNYGTHPLAADIPTKLAYAYENDGRYLRAAELFEGLSQGAADDALARQTLWRAAGLREKAGRSDLAVATYEQYLRRYPQPLDTATDVRSLLAEMAAKAGDVATRDRWLNELITNARAGTTDNLHVRLLAGQACLTLGDGKSAEFDGIPLNLPLEKSLAGKRKAMEQALKWYEEAGRYGIAEVTTAATFQTAEIYRRLAKDLLASERPSGLNQLEAEQYKILLEEEAFPFEEKATKFHELNYGRIPGGIYDVWVKNSMQALRALLAARYDRVELQETYFDYVPPKSKAGAASTEKQPGEGHAQPPAK